MIIKEIKIHSFRSFKPNTSFFLGKNFTLIAGRNATQKTTILGMLGQPFSISLANNPLHGEKTVDGYNFRSQFSEKFKISQKFDKIGTHEWTLNLDKNKCGKDHFTVMSISRKQKGKKETLRFWNKESRKAGDGYIQIPVYYLSLSRLFPIGETGKTHAYKINLRKDETDYCLQNYRGILSIQQKEGENIDIDLEEQTSSRKFAGVNTGQYDIFTNSAGESNITRIILAVLSFKRLQEKYKKDYKGGILLIDELDATVYPFSQKKLVNYLLESARKYNIQIIATTHSPIIFDYVNKLMIENQEKEQNWPLGAKSVEFVYLQPEYTNDNSRLVAAKNIKTKDEFDNVFLDILLETRKVTQKIRIYPEDEVASSFLNYIFNKKKVIENYEIMHVNVGWLNYIYLYSHNVEEFKRNIIILDNDVEQGQKENKSNYEIFKSMKNAILLPLTVEPDLFKFYKDHKNFNRLLNKLNSDTFSYDVCFKDWTENSYDTSEYKKWYQQLCENVHCDLLFEVWCNENRSKINKFMYDLKNCENYIKNNF